MSSTKKAKKPAKSSKKKSQKEKEARANGRIAALGEGLKEFSKSLPKDVAPTVQILIEARSPTNAQLIKLKDAVKAAAAEAREKKDRKLSLALANLNRGVRKLERASR